LKKVGGEKALMDSFWGPRAIAHDLLGKYWEN